MAWLRAGSRRTVGVVANLSVTGAFIELSDPPPLGDWVRVELDLPGTSPSKATIFCHVVNRRDAADQGPSGIGVTFQSVDAATERAIRDVVEAQAARYVP